MSARHDGFGRRQRIGFFSLPMAEMVGPGGKVVCVDVQPKMLQVLLRRAAEAGLAERIETHVSTEDSLGLRAGQFLRFCPRLHDAARSRQPSQLPPGDLPTAQARCPLLLTEPIKHVSRTEFDRTVSLAQQEGFLVTGHPLIRLSQTVVLTKPPESR